MINQIFKSLEELDVGELNKYNILPYEYYTVRPYTIDAELEGFVVSGVKNVLKNKSVFFKEIVYDYVESRKLVFVNYSKYIFPAFITSDSVLCINLGNKKNKDIVSINPVDLYTYTLYGVILKECMLNIKRFVGMENDIANFFKSVFVRLYRKKEGLQANEEYINYLGYVLYLYTFCALFNYENSDNLKRIIASNLVIDVSNLKLNYDFSRLSDTLKALKDNNIISTSLYSFYATVSNSFCVYSFPLFEDISRFMATIASASIRDNNVISTRWYIVNPTLFRRIITYLNNLFG